MKNNFSNHIVRDPKILGGMLILKDTRVSVIGVLTALSEGKNVEQIVSDLHYAGYKKITSQQIVTAIDYAKQLVV